MVVDAGAIGSREVAYGLPATIMFGNQSKDWRAEGE